MRNKEPKRMIPGDVAIFGGKRSVCPTYNRHFSTGSAVIVLGVSDDDDIIQPAKRSEGIDETIMDLLGDSGKIDGWCKFRLSALEEVP